MSIFSKFLAQPAIANWLIRRALRTPYSDIIKDGELYMKRYWLFNPYPDSGASGADRPRWQFPISIRIHHIIRPDQDRDMHDHPWNARTVILRGSYMEIRREESTAQCADFFTLSPWENILRYRRAGETATLKFGEYHRITEISEGGVWTMFITGKYRGTWGFLVNGEKIQWRKYLGLEKP